MTSVDDEYAYLGTLGATGTINDRRAQTYTPDDFSYFSSRSGLTPVERFSLSDHKLAYYKLQTGQSGTLADVEAAFFRSPPVGYDIFLLMGQSNMSGRGTPTDSTLDPVNPRIFQWMSKGGLANTIQPAAEPLDMHDTATGIGPGLQFARHYVNSPLSQGKRVLLIPVARGGTPLVDAAALAWRATTGGGLYANAKNRALAALAAAEVAYPGKNAIKGALWLQGETDGDNAITGAAYQADLDLLINTLRTDLSLPNLPFVIGTMVPEYLGTGTRAQIDLVQRNTPIRLSKVDTAMSAVGMNKGDGNHFSRAGQEYNGLSFFTAYSRIVNNQPPVTATATALGIASPAPLAAYSLRKVNPSYGGAAVRVRRSSDNTEIDIGFTGNDLNTAALTAHLAGSDGFVTVWYDQVGSKNVAQATVGFQPRIATAGVIVTSGGKPAITFDGTDDRLQMAASLGLFDAGAGTILQVISAAVASGSRRVWAEGNSGGSTPQYGLMQPDLNLNIRAVPIMSGAFTAGTIQPLVNGSVWDGTIHQSASSDNGTSISSWVDGALDLNAFAYTRPAATLNTFAIGGVIRSGTLAPMPMTASEFVFYGSALGTTDRQTGEANQKSYYGTP